MKNRREPLGVPTAKPLGKNHLYSRIHLPSGTLHTYLPYSPQSWIQSPKSWVKPWNVICRTLHTRSWPFHASLFQSESVRRRSTTCTRLWSGFSFFCLVNPSRRSPETHETGRWTFNLILLCKLHYHPSRHVDRPVGSVFCFPRRVDFHE